MSSQNDSMPYKPGTIKFIKLINFMCHESFELPLGPNVNFIIGPNGSGKSALLTALTVAFGARATNTARGKRASDLIKYGAKWARIIIVVHNYDKIMNKDQGFKPDDYGKTITIEKTIYRDEASRLALKNDKDKRVSERKQELDEMMDHFGIVVNNPICILNQEVSKTFLHSKKPEDKFELFMKATNLEQIEQDYQSANLSFKEWNNTNSRKNVSFALLDKEYAACEEKVSFLMQSAKLKDLLEKLNREFVFAADQENEEKAKDLEKQVQAINKIVEDAQIEIDQKKEKIRQFDEDIQISRTKIEAINKNMEEARKKFQEIQTKELDRKREQREINNKISSLKIQLSRQFSEKKNLEKSIEEKRKELKDQNRLDNDSEQRKLEIERLEKEIPHDQAREKSLRLHTNQLNESLTSVRSELQAATSRVSDLKNKLAQQHAIKRRLQNGQENSLRKYGDHVIRIREEIDRAHAAGRFKHKPIGPLGYYIKLRSPDVAGPLELHLGKNAHAFVCDNNQDMNTLSTIFKRFSTDAHNFRQPLLITRPFVSKHNVSQFRADHPTYKTLLDHIHIEDNNVFNALVDRCSLESVLFIPEYHLAEALMIDKNAIPRNTRMAYTKDCSCMHPRTDHGGYRSFANRGNRFLFAESNTNQIREVEKEISLLEAGIRDAENIAKDIQTSFSVQRNEYEQNQQESKKLTDETRKKEEQLLNLRQIITVQPQEIVALEAEYEAVNNSIASLELDLEKQKESSGLLQNELDDIKTEKEASQNLVKLHEKNRQAELAVIDGTKASINAFQQKVHEKQVIIENKNKKKAELKVLTDEHLARLARTKQQINENWIRPTQIRRMEVITAEMNKVRTQIEVQEEENQDPEEIIRNMTKRMEEIKSLTAVKEKNASNYRSCEQKLSNRKEGFATLRSNTISAVSATFSTVMRTMKMNGVLQIHLDDVTHRGEVIKKARTLEMRIDTNYTPSQRISLAAVDPPSRPKKSRVSATNNANNGVDIRPLSLPLADKENEVRMTDTRSLSGGERSFSTVAFVLALWHHCVSPFKLMDEIDVFMDMVTRRVSYNALIRFAQQTEDPGQFIFFSPLELPHIDKSGSYVRVFEMPSIVKNKRPHPDAGDEPDEE